MNFQAMSKQRKFILIAAAIGIISVFLPWITLGGETVANGFHGGGVVVFLGFVGVVILSLMGDQARPLEKSMWLVVLGAGAIALLFAIIKISQISGSAFGIVSPGFGLWIAVAVSIAVVACAWIFRNPGDTLQSGFDSLKKNMSQNTPSAPTTTTTTSKVDELEKLIELKNQGKITEEEYIQMKSKII